MAGSGGGAKLHLWPRAFMSTGVVAGAHVCAVPKHVREHRATFFHVQLHSYAAIIAQTSVGQMRSTRPKIQLHIVQLSGGRAQKIA